MKMVKMNMLKTSKHIMHGSYKTKRHQSKLQYIFVRLDYFDTFTKGKNIHAK